MGKTSYAIALGSNRGANPRATIARALDALVGRGVVILANSCVVASVAMGAGMRDYANAAAIVETPLEPGPLLALCKAIEAEFGRRPGRRWGDRPLDLDIILWSKGSFASDALTIPHPAFRARGFVLGPLAEIAPDWRDPLTGLSVRQLAARLAHPRPVDRLRPGS